MSEELKKTYKQGDINKCVGKPKSELNIDNDIVPYCKDAYADNV
jgi:hypothetical protein